MGVEGTWVSGCGRFGFDPPTIASLSPLDGPPLSNLVAQHLSHMHGVFLSNLPPAWNFAMGKRSRHCYCRGEIEVLF